MPRWKPKKKTHNDINYIRAPIAAQHKDDDTNAETTPTKPGYDFMITNKIKIIRFH